MSPNPLSPVAKNKLVQVSGYPPRFPNLRFPYAVFPCFQKTWGANKVCPRDGPHPGWLYPEYLSRPKSAFEVGRMSDMSGCLAETLKFHGFTDGPFDTRKCPPKKLEETQFSCHLIFFGGWTPIHESWATCKGSFHCRISVFLEICRSTTSYWGIV